MHSIYKFTIEDYWDITHTDAWECQSVIDLQKTSIDTFKERTNFRDDVVAKDCVAKCVDAIEKWNDFQYNEGKLFINIKSNEWYMCIEARTYRFVHKQK